MLTPPIFVVLCLLIVIGAPVLVELHHRWLIRSLKKRGLI